MSPLHLQFRFKPMHAMISCLLIFAMTAGLFNVLPSSVHADTKPLSIQIETGFEGKLKEGKTGPVKLTITNPGDDISGDIAIHIAHPSDENDVVYLKHIDLPRNSTKTVWMSVPGMTYNRNNNAIQFYSGGYGGEKVPFKQGAVSLSAGTLGLETIQVGVLARDPDTMNFLTLLKQPNVQVLVYPLNEASLPSDTFMLDGLEMLVINDFASTELSNDQVEAIKAWTNRGGHLVLAGGAGYTKSAEAFKDISPIDVHGTLSVDELSSLTKHSGKALNLGEPFTLSNGTSKRGDVVLKEGEVPLYVIADQGQGHVWYAAYDLSLNPIASWNGNQALWAKLFSDAGSDIGANHQTYGQPDVWELNNALDYFPSLVPPSFGALIWVFFAYILIAAPILYLILKRLDKREWAWVLIPAISVVSSLCIYWIGAQDRNTTLAQSLNVVELNEDGRDYISRSMAFFVPNGGDYEVTLTENQHVLPLDHYYGGTRNLRGNDYLAIKEEDGQTRVNFLDVPYWSIRKLAAENTASEDWGQLSYSMQYEANAVSGEVKNDTKHAIEDVTFVMNMQYVQIGSLDPGESKSFKMAYNPGMGANYHYFFDIANMIYPHNYPDDPVHERALLITALQKQINKNVSTPIFFGYSRTADHTILINDKDVPIDELNLLVQPVNVDLVSNDKVFIPYGHLTPVVTENSVDSYATYPEQFEVEIGMGHLVFEYSLPQLEDVQYEHMNISQMNPPFLTQEIWNEQLQSWERLELQQQTQLTSVSDYITPGGAIRLRVTNTQQTTMFRFPNLALEGTVGS